MKQLGQLICAISVAASPDVSTAAPAPSPMVAVLPNHFVSIHRESSIVGTWTTASYNGLSTIEFRSDGTFSGIITTFSSVTQSYIDGRYTVLDLGGDWFELTTEISSGDFGAPRTRLQTYRFQSADVVISDQSGEISYRLR